jgi:hypothetical protein
MIQSPPAESDPIHAGARKHAALTLKNAYEPTRFAENAGISEP